MQGVVISKKVHDKRRKKRSGTFTRLRRSARPGLLRARKLSVNDETEER